MSRVGDVLSKLTSPKRITNGGLGTEPPALDRFCSYLEKNAIFTPLDPISHVFRTIWKN